MELLIIRRRRDFVVFDFEKPNIEIAEISEDKKYSKFVVEPLERGYGTTLGNSPEKNYAFVPAGSAVSQVKSTEFCTNSVRFRV